MICAPPTARGDGGPQIASEKGEALEPVLVRKGRAYAIEYVRPRQRGNGSRTAPPRATAAPRPRAQGHRPVSDRATLSHPVPQAVEAVYAPEEPRAELERRGDEERLEALLIGRAAPCAASAEGRRQAEALRRAERKLEEELIFGRGAASRGHGARGSPGRPASPAAGGGARVPPWELTSKQGSSSQAWGRWAPSAVFGTAPRFAPPPGLPPAAAAAARDAAVAPPPPAAAPRASAGYREAQRLAALGCDSQLSFARGGRRPDRVAVAPPAGPAAPRPRRPAQVCRGQGWYDRERSRVLDQKRLLLRQVRREVRLAHAPAAAAARPAAPRTWLQSWQHEERASRFRGGRPRYAASEPPTRTGLRDARALAGRADRGRVRVMVGSAGTR